MTERFVLEVQPPTGDEDGLIARFSIHERICETDGYDS